MEDVYIIRQIKQGNIDNLEILIARYQEKALHAAFLITQSQVIAEDVVQETFVHILLHLKQFDESKPFGPYFFRSVMNAALNAVKREKRWILIEDLSVTETDKLLSTFYEFDSSANNQEVIDDLRQALEKLPPRERMVIVYRYYLGMSEKEMSSEMNLAPGTIKWWLHSARKRLANLIHLERSQ